MNTYPRDLGPLYWTGSNIRQSWLARLLMRLAFRVDGVKSIYRRYSGEWVFVRMDHDE